MILELSYSFVLGVVVLGYKDGTAQNKSWPTKQIWEVFGKYPLRHFVSIIDLHLEGRVGNLSD